MRKVIVNYQPLYDLWESCLEERLDRETCSRIIGCQTQMSQFRFFFGLNLAHTVYSLTDNLSKTLQKEKLSASAGKSVAMKTVETFQNMRSESSADLFFEIVSRKASSFNFIADPELPRKRKNPNYKTLNDFFTVNDPQSQSSEPYHPKTVKEHYRTMYYEALHAIINSIKERFDQESVQVFASIESLLLKSIYLPEETIKELEEYISKLYGDEIDLVALKIEANVLRTIVKDKVSCFKDIYQVVKDCSEGERGLMPNIIHAIKLLLVNPSTSCTPERSFSTARRLKTWLSATMKSKRFNSLAVLHIHKDLTDILNLKDIGIEFVSAREGRRDYFGKFV